MNPLRAIRGQLPLVLRVTGQAQRDLAELILDLDDLVHMATKSLDPVTPKTFERIRAEPDAAAADKAFYRIQAFLGARGIKFEKNYSREAPGDVVLEFDVEAVRKLIRPEIAAACHVLRAEELARRPRRRRHRARFRPRRTGARRKPERPRGEP